MDKDNKERIERRMPPLQGLVIPPSNIGIFREEKEVVRYQPPKTNGQEVCRRLRAMRAELAALNNIPLLHKPCHFTGPCAGTCPVCDEEIRYINRELNKIPPEQRVYPDQYMKEKSGDA